VLPLEIERGPAPVQSILERLPLEIRSEVLPLEIIQTLPRTGGPGLLAAVAILGGLGLAVFLRRLR
jgi:hypothetical protein